MDAAGQFKQLSGVRNGKRLHSVPFFPLMYLDGLHDTLRAGNGNVKPDSQGSLLGSVHRQQPLVLTLQAVSRQASGPQGSLCSPHAEGSGGPGPVNLVPQDGPYLSPWSVSP